MPTVALIGGALFVLQQFAGINGVLYFSSLTFKDVGIESGGLASLYIGLTNFAGLQPCSLKLFVNKYSVSMVPETFLFVLILLSRCSIGFEFS